MITYLFFLLLATLTIASAFMVVSAANPVHSVLFLIFCFFSSAGLFIISGAEFVSMILLVVYVGAVAVLFMFVVMMLDMDSNGHEGEVDDINDMNFLKSLSIKPLHFLKDFFVSKIGAFIFKGLLSLLVFLLSVGSLLSVFNILDLLPNDLTIFGLYRAISSGEFVSGEYVSRITLFLQSSDYGLETFLISLTLISSLLLSFVLAFGIVFDGEDKTQTKDSFISNIPWATFVVGLVFFEFLFVLYRHNFSIIESIKPGNSVIDSSLSNAHQISKVLYTDNIVAFQLAGVLLLLSMIGAIVLTIHHKINVKRQNIANQVSRMKSDTCKLLEPEVGKGVDV